MTKFSGYRYRIYVPTTTVYDKRKCDRWHHILQVNAVVFPVVYHDKFYRDVLDAGELAKLAYYNDIVVGAVCCRVDTSAESGERKLYIMTLGV